MSKKAKGLGDALKRKQETYTDQAKKAEQAASGQEPTKRLNVKLPESLHQAFKEKAEGEGRTMSWLVTQWIEDYVSNNE